MPATAEIAQPADLDIAKMTKVQKLAALLIILGPESAAQILKGLDEDKVHKSPVRWPASRRSGPRAPA